MAHLTHIDADGNAQMVDVSAKADTARTAIATGHILLGPAAVAAIAERTAKKGDVLGVAQLAGICGAKRTADLIPLCHPLPLSHASVAFEVLSDRVVVTATTKTTGKTGVEMEALTAVSTALLTIYDMLKAIDKGMELGGICLVKKEGGRSGTWTRSAP